MDRSRGIWCLYPGSPTGHGTRPLSLPRGRHSRDAAHHGTGRANTVSKADGPTGDHYSNGFCARMSPGENGARGDTARIRMVRLDRPVGRTDARVVRGEGVYSGSGRIPPSLSHSTQVSVRPIRQMYPTASMKADLELHAVSSRCRSVRGFPGCFPNSETRSFPECRHGIWHHLAICPSER